VRRESRKLFFVRRESRKLFFVRRESRKLWRLLEAIFPSNLP
jgi:ribosomal protein L24E